MTTNVGGHQVRRRHIAWFALGCLGSAFLVWVLLVFLHTSETTAAIRETQTTNHSLLIEVQSLSHQVLDCTEAGGKCYRRGQARTAAAVTQINRASISRAACTVVLSHQPGVEHLTAVDLTQRITACVAETLAALAKQ